MRSHYVSSAVIGLVGLFALPASAHIQITFPPPREGATSPELKTFPCGITGLNRSTDPTRITTFRPGQTITVRWTETIGHTGHFRIAFDDSGVDAFQDPASYTDIQTTPALPILLDGIADMAVSGTQYQSSITLPQIECTNCTLQVIQVMTDKPPYLLSVNGGDDVYHQCADIVLSNSADGGTGGATDAGTARDSGGSTGTGGSTATGTGGSSGGGGSAGTGGAATGSGGTTGSGGAATGTGGATTGSGGAGNTGGSAGTSGSTGTGGAVTDAGGSPGAAPAAAPDDGGCALAGSRRSFGGATSITGLLALAAFLQRRRRARSGR
jgi:hypothetical protein